jgi:hypothetical protein
MPTKALNKLIYKPFTLSKEENLYVMKRISPNSFSPREFKQSTSQRKYSLITNIKKSFPTINRLSTK